LSGKKVYAIDQSPEMLEVARQNTRQDSLNIDFQRGSLDNLPFISKTFDLLVCGLALCHIPDLKQVINEFSRVTRAGGYLLITDFHPDAVAQGWQTVSVQADAVYILPNMSHTREDYLKSIEAASFKLLKVIDLYVRDLPESVKLLHEPWVREQGHRLFGLIILAQKVK
jgi:ubiquinone/menaquinone biosynthesis C-methylase UbiE